MILKNLKIHHFKKSLSHSAELAKDHNGDSGRFVCAEEIQFILSEIEISLKLERKKYGGGVSSAEVMVSKSLEFLE